MTEKIAFDLVAPDRLVSSVEVDMVVVPGMDGDFGALKGHAPLISSLRPGLIEVHNNGRVTERVFIPGGFAEVNQTRLTILAEEAENAADLSVAVVRQDLTNAQEDLADASDAATKDEAKKRVNALTVKIAVLERVNT